MQIFDRNLCYIMPIHEENDENLCYRAKECDEIMKRTSHSSEGITKAKVSAYSQEATYENAMKVYKIFAQVTGVILTAAFVISKIF